MAPESARRRTAVRLRATAVLLSSCALPGALAAQQAAPRDTVPPADSAGVGISPRGAMLRSFLVPGWGQSTVGSYRRGAIFFTLRVSSGYMLFRTVGRLNAAREVVARGERMAMDSLDALVAVDEKRWHLLVDDRGLSDPQTYAAAVDSFPGLGTKRRLVKAREQQRQDWITTLIVMTLLDGIDAYVNAQFDDFPVGIGSAPAPGGGASFRLTVPVGWGGAPRSPRPTRAATAPLPRSRRK